MQTRDNAIDRLLDLLGAEATRADAELLFDFMRDRDLIAFHERDGYQIPQDIDLPAVFEKMIAAIGEAT